MEKNYRARSLKQEGETLVEYSANERLARYLDEYSEIFGLDFSHIDCKETLYWPAVFILQGDVEWSTRHYLGVTLKQLFNARNRYELKPKQGAKLLFFNQTSRADHVEAFNKVASLSPEADVVQVEVTPRRFAPLRVCLKRVCRLARWGIKKGRTKLSWREFWFTAPFAQLALEAKEQFERWDLTRYNAIVFYYDFNWISDVLRQLAKAEGIATVTLQHGVFFPKVELPATNEVLRSRSSNADTFLTWSEATMEDIIATGVAREKIVVCGHPKYIGCVQEPMIRRERAGVFGVISGIQSYEDIQMIRVACEIAEKTGWKFYIRYHPLQQGDEYDAKFSSPYYLGNAAGFSIDEYVQKTDFSLVEGSSMLYDLLWHGAHVYHYIDETGHGSYPQKECSFSNAQQVIEMEKDLERTGELYTELQRKMLGPKDAEQCYRNFFVTL